tara:strand:- start:655 stop:1863 length:1209 start_codon:yes stop_codon:yes gene_type:complete
MNHFYTKYISSSLIQHLFNTVFFPYFTIILMSQRLSLDLWGEIIFIQAIAGFLLLFLNMGIEFHGTNKIASSSNRDTKIVGKYNFIKIINIFLVLVFGYIFVHLGFFPERIFFMSAILSASISLNPSWVFLVEKNITPIISIEIFFRTIFLTFIFLYVVDDNKGSFYIYFLAINNLLIALFSSLYLRIKYTYLFLIKTNYMGMIKKLSGLFYYQISGISTMMLPVIILGSLSDFRTVAIFGNADKLFKGLRGLFSPLTRIAITIFTKIVDETRKSQIRLFSIIFITGAIIVLVLLGFSSFLITFLLGEKYAESIPVFNVLIISIPFIWSYNFLVGSYFIPKKLEWLITKYNILLLLISSFLIPISILLFEELGLSVAVLLIEFLLFSLLIRRFFKKDKIKQI